MGQWVHKQTDCGQWVRGGLSSSSRAGRFTAVRHGEVALRRGCSRVTYRHVPHGSRCTVKLCHTEVCRGPESGCQGCGQLSTDSSHWVWKGESEPLASFPPTRAGPAGVQVERPLVKVGSTLDPCVCTASAWPQPHRTRLGSSCHTVSHLDRGLSKSLQLESNDFCGLSGPSLLG